MMDWVHVGGGGCGLIGLCTKSTIAAEEPDPTEGWYAMVAKDKKAGELPAAVEKGARVCRGGVCVGLWMGCMCVGDDGLVIAAVSGVIDWSTPNDVLVD